MSNSKHRKDHKKKLCQYKTTIKQNRERLQKQLFNSFMNEKRQEEFKNTQDSDISIDTGINIEPENEISTQSEDIKEDN